MTNEKFTITNTTKRRPPRLPFLEVKKEILGKHFELGVVFIGDMRSKTLNKKFRGKDKVANILTFPLSKKDGEIYINLNEVYKDSKKFLESYENFLMRVYIHGLLHLNGRKHNSTMEREEAKLLKNFLKKYKIK
jgi:rRNA maturation RNase YbeY